MYVLLGPRGHITKYDSWSLSVRTGNQFAHFTISFEFSLEKVDDAKEGSGRKVKLWNVSVNPEGVPGSPRVHDFLQYRLWHKPFQRPTKLWWLRVVEMECQNTVKVVQGLNNDQSGRTHTYTHQRSSFRCDSHFISPTDPKTQHGMWEYSVTLAWQTTSSFDLAMRLGGIRCGRSHRSSEVSLLCPQCSDILIIIFVPLNLNMQW